MITTDTVREAQQAPAEPGDHERFSHYVEKVQTTESIVMGTPCTALCGKTWVPSRDGRQFPLCPECDRAYRNLPG